MYQYASKGKNAFSRKMLYLVFKIFFFENFHIDEMYLIKQFENFHQWVRLSFKNKQYWPQVLQIAALLSKVKKNYFGWVKEADFNKYQNFASRIVSWVIWS